MSAVELVEYIVEGLVHDQEGIRIDEIEGTEETVMELRVSQNDVGKVIGKNGSVARALRTLITASGSREQRNYILEIID